jgi:predicted nucleic acid-binding protein
VSYAVDSSVAIAAILADHPAHDEAEAALSRSRTTIAHVATETYSVLTRLPAPHRLTASTAAAILAAKLPSAWITLDASAHAEAVTKLSQASISGGATYDGLIALSAREHELELLSRDHRAARTYKALGIPYQLLTA